MLSRRTLVSGLISIAATGPISGASLAAADASPPHLDTPRAQFIELRPLREPPALQLERIDGKKLGLDQLRGKAVLLNFWATWCPPCRRELPILENLEQATAREALAIAAISIDQGGRTAVERFLKEVRVRTLRPFLDPSGQIAAPVRADTTAPFVLWGLPITYIIDRQGRVAGYITGEVDWMSERARAFLHYYENG